MGKNIVICCDGTGEKLDVHRTNVARLVSLMKSDDPDAQMSWYDPGVGTLPATGALTWLSQRLTLEVGLWLGYGLVDKIELAYGFIVDHYVNGDSIYLFGFSRGALTVRAVGGLLHRIGVLRHEGKNLIPYALELYKQHYTWLNDSKQRERFQGVVREFREIFCWQGLVDIKFLGLWDTVKAFGFFWPKSLPHLRHNPDVRTVRHALALNEHRREFLPTSWGGLDNYIEERVPAHQDVKEVWFAGDHSDVGGGHCEEESGLSWLSLKWMINEARNCGLRFDETKVNRVLNHQVLPSGRVDMSDGFWRVHDLRQGKYLIVEKIPRFELTNAPPCYSSHENRLEPTVPLPIGWPKRQLRFTPTFGVRHPEEFKRNGKVLFHNSVRELIERSSYDLPTVDSNIISFVDG